jgi:hypothetical protein
MIPQWNEATAPRASGTRLLYLKVFQDALGGLSQGMVLGTDFALRLAEVRSRAASLLGSGQVRALQTAAALAKPRQTMTPAQIRALAADAIAHPHKVAGRLAELLALLGGDEAEEGKL